MENKIKLTCKNLSTLKDEYGVSLHTMRKWLLSVNGLKVEGRATRNYTPKVSDMIRAFRKSQVNSLIKFKLEFIKANLVM